MTDDLLIWRLGPGGDISLLEDVGSGKYVVRGVDNAEAAVSVLHNWLRIPCEGRADQFTHTLIERNMRVESMTFDERVWLLSPTTHFGPINLLFAGK